MHCSWRYCFEKYYWFIHVYKKIRCTQLHGPVDVKSFINWLTKSLQTDNKCPLNLWPIRVDISTLSFQRLKNRYPQLQNFFSHAPLNVRLKTHACSILLQANTEVLDFCWLMFQSYICCSRFDLPLLDQNAASKLLDFSAIFFNIVSCIFHSLIWHSFICKPGEEYLFPVLQIFPKACAQLTI